MRLGVPFIAPRQLGAVGGQLGRPNLPSIGWCTGQSGAPPDSPCSYPVRDRLPNHAHPTVAAPGPLAHHTVWCPPPTVGAATRRAKIARPTVGSPDSPVNYSHVAFLLFPRATSSPWMTHRTVRCTTGQFGAPLDSPVNYSCTPPSTPESGLFTGDQSGAPDSPVCQAELEFAAHSQLFFQFFSHCF
jgi:hypothetical protein